ncbi:helix-turn-helix transcriptional regulator [Mucilaginibacter sp. Bleaf8]|uniref:helix-turn-helix domain-containing protein n=1 Tax=Mucilaginibacter sp. Bleaf8 TaxID=2834430 RepID=UPI001BCBBFEE|nr:AraC family transcriptional regulator [Mucilaginibacter sp. Bleaf8]MBS7565291.1 helix-turn-helix transcriptional regulator [Mucilaginibacter sp. Bleaf8]
MKIHIKNMVCHRCKLAVEAELKSSGYHPTHVELGEVTVSEELSHQQLAELNTKLKHLGFELIDDRKSRTVEKIKNLVIKLVHHTDTTLAINLSEYLAEHLHYEYKYLSNLFSETEGTTIEKYYISQKIEKVKELLIYDELTLSQIAYRMGYSSVAYLSNQFKKETGLTPTHFKTIKDNKRRNIEEL